LPIGLAALLPLHGKTQQPVVRLKAAARGYQTVEYVTAMLNLVAGKLTLTCY